MKKCTLAALAMAFAAIADAADQITSFVGDNVAKTMTVSADRIAADRTTSALFATGHVVAVSAPMRLHSDFIERDTNGVCRMGKESSLTTCTNAHDHLHWEIKGEVEYQDGDHILLRNAWLRLWDVPVFWIPYFYYPMGGEFAIQIVPGYTSRWGGYVMTKYKYTLLGDPKTGNDGMWLNGDTRLDYRWKNGVAFGEDLNWSLGNWGQGHFKIYYAWDHDYERYGVSSGGYNDMNWGSVVPYNRYGIELAHRVDVTERDVVRGKMALYSDSFFRSDFFRTASFSIKNSWHGYAGNELAWEHTENLFGFGISVSGPMNKFQEGAMRLPEVYFDLAPMPVWNLPINYETQNRLGYLARQAAKYEGASDTVFGNNPGIWADYDTIRFDTYHRFTAPFRTWDVMSVVPRVAYRGTYWNDAGNTVVGGQAEAGKSGNAFRSIFEAGVTFAGRGTAWIGEKWQHMIEPYADVLAQEAWYAGLSDGNRPYIFDSLDASSDWSDQFAGRSRNLPYSWYGVTPGVRNVLRSADEAGALHTDFDLDIYVALQCNDADWTTGGDSYKLSEPGKPNYGSNHFLPVPGGRVRWYPFDEAFLGGRIEYDSENNKIAQAQLFWQHKVCRDFSYRVSYYGRDHRYWDYSSSPVYETGTSDYDGFNWANFSIVEVGFEHELCDAFAWSPYVRWDCRLGELDEIGAWIDLYRTDCLGFRLNIAYENEYTRIDGSTEDRDYRIGFYIYLRAFGPSQGLQIGD